MEHRYNKRLDEDLNLQVLLYSSGKPVASGKIKNISAGGAYIKTDYQPDFAKCYIEFAFVSDEKNDACEHHTKALIIHQTENGFGLMTEEDDSLSGLISEQLDTHNKMYHIYGR